MAFNCGTFALPTFLVCFIITILAVFLSSFESFVVNDVESVKFDISPPLAKRVVFITIDGLGARVLEETNHKYVKFLTQIAKSEGQMGLVKANAPTETRPSHVALLAGFNEDIFNIRNAWKANIRPFNAILHNTQFSWAYGHPVALSSFKLLPDDPRNQRLKLEHYSAVSYSHSYADDFVLDKFQAFVKSDLPKFVEQDGETDDGRCGKLIFLHLSSVDDVAHRVGTKDSLFYQTVDNADKVVEKVYHHFRLSLSREDLATTAFIVTADHGTKPEGGHGGSTDDEIYVPYFIWGAGISQKPQQNLLGDSPILPQNSMSIFMASLLSTILPSNSQGIVPVHLLNTSTEVKAGLVRDNIRHLMKLREVRLYRWMFFGKKALLRRSNRHSILPLFYAHEEDLPNDLGILLEKEVKLQDSLRIARWAAWFVDFIFWTISMVFLSLALSINLTDSQPCIPRSKIRFYTRLGIFGLASIELYRVVRWLLDYTKEPNYQEMNILSFGCIVCEISLCGYATVGRKLLVKLFKSTGPQRGQILRFLLAILQTYLTVRGFDEPRHFAAAGALLVADLVFDETVRRKGKHAVLLLIVLALLLGLWICILHSRSGIDEANLTGLQVMHVLLLTLFWFIFTRLVSVVKISRISFWDWTLSELRIMLFNFLLLNAYMFGLSIYSTDKVLLMLKIRAGWSHISRRILLANFLHFPIIALLIAYIYGTWKRGHQQGKSALQAQALAWILLTPLTFVQGTANVGYTDSWSEIIKHLAYFIYLSVGPLICALLLIAMSHILCHLNA